jgi:hypothetical protein
MKMIIFLKRSVQQEEEMNVLHVNLIVVNSETISFDSTLQYFDKNV